MNEIQSNWHQSIALEEFYNFAFESEPIGRIVGSQSYKNGADAILRFTTWFAYDHVTGSGQTQKTLDVARPELSNDVHVDSTGQLLQLKVTNKVKIFKNNLTLGRPWEVIQLIATAWMLRLLINILGRTCGHFSFPLTSMIVAESVCTPWLWRCLPDAGRSHSDLTFTPTGLLSVIFHVFPSLLIFSSCISFLASCVEHCYLLCCLQEA